MQSKHTLSYCDLCETEMIICASCGNPSCNGTYGTIDGSFADTSHTDKYCPDCLTLDELLSQYRSNPDSIEFLGKVPIKSYRRNVENLGT